MISEVEANEKNKEGWIKVWMAFEVLAVNEKVAKDSLEALIEKMDKSEMCKLYKKQFGNVKEVQKPLGNIEKAFSVTCEVELISKKFQDLVGTVMEFGPSAVEILDPLSLNLQAGEAQTVLNVISQMIHRFAAARMGGIPISKDKV